MKIRHHWVLTGRAAIYIFVICRGARTIGETDERTDGRTMGSRDEHGQEGMVDRVRWN